MSNHKFNTEILMDVYRIRDILKTNIFAPENASHPLKQSAFTELIIRLHDLLQKCCNSKVPVRFTDDVDIMPEVNDVTNLVAKIRSAVCHITSKTHQIFEDGGKFTFNTIYGSGVLAEIGDVQVKNNFADDVCFFFGKYRIYPNRHITRAFTEAKANLIPLTEYPSQLFD